MEELLRKPAAELTEIEFKKVLEFKRQMYGKLLDIVPGETKAQKDKKIEHLSFDECISLVLGHEQKQ